MDWDGLRQRLRNELESLWARIQESPATQQLREKYESLNPRTQKLVFGTLISGALFLIVWSPIATWWSSQDALQSFENRRALIRQMFTLSKESQSLTPLPPAPDDASLKDLYRNALLEANLGESQITQIETSAQVLDSLPAAVLRSVLDVKLASLNLRQVTEIGHLLQGLNPSVRLQDLTIKAAAEAGYFDVLFRMAVLKVPEVILQSDSPAGSEDSKSTRSGFRGNRPDSKGARGGR